MLQLRPLPGLCPLITLVPRFPARTSGHPLAPNSGSLEPPLDRIISHIVVVILSHSHHFQHSQNNDKRSELIDTVVF